LDAADGDTIEEFVRDGAERVRVAIQGSEKHVLPLAFIELVEFQGRHLAQLAKMMMPTQLNFIQRFGERRGKLRQVPTPIVLRMLFAVFVGYILTEMVLKNLPIFKDAEYDWFDGMMDIYLHGILESEA
jgi:hypothetical protein